MEKTFEETVKETVIAGKNPDRVVPGYTNYPKDWAAQYNMLLMDGITCKSCKHWQSNDGDGLNGKQSKALAAVLEAEIASGRTLTHEQQRKAAIDALPDESCHWCRGTPCPNLGRVCVAGPYGAVGRRLARVDT